MEQEGIGKRPSRWLVVTVIFISFLLVAVTLFSWIFAVLIVSSDKTEEEISDVRVFRYTSIDKSTNRRSSGLVSLYHDLENEYMFMGSEERYTLISNFGINEYECTGTCFCGSKEDENRRNVASKVSRPLYYLLAAATSFLAFKLAEDYFKEECTRVMSENNNCNTPDEITSIIDSCNQIDTFEKTTETNQYVCEGHCISRSMMHPKYYGTHLNFNMVMIKQLIAFKKSGDCQSLIHHQVVKVPWMLYPGEECTEEDAIKFFIEKYLHPFCKNEPSSVLWWNDQETGERMNINMCLGAGEYNFNPSVRCRTLIVPPEEKS